MIPVPIDRAEVEALVSWNIQQSQALIMFAASWAKRAKDKMISKEDREEARKKAATQRQLAKKYRDRSFEHRKRLKAMPNES